MVSRSVSKEFGRMSGMFSDYSNNVVVVLCIWLHQYSVAHTLNCGHNDKVEQHFNISCHLTILLVCTLTVCIEWCWTYLTKQRSSTQHSFLAYKYHLFWYLHTQYFFPQPWKKQFLFIDNLFFGQTFEESSGFCILLNCTISATTARATTFSSICFNTF